MIKNDDGYNKLKKRVDELEGQIDKAKAFLYKYEGDYDFHVHMLMMLDEYSKAKDRIRMIDTHFSIRDWTNDGL